MKFIKKFNEVAEYQQFKDSSEYILPNVSYVKNSDKVNYNPFVVVETRLVCTYNVTDTTSPTQLCYFADFISMEIDGVMMDNVTYDFTFDSVGEHTVKFELADPTTIGEGTFYYCHSLTSVVIPDSVTSIGGQAFTNCKSLTSVEIGSGCTYISGSAFYGCRGLTGELIIPDSITTIGDYAFCYCEGLTSVVIPNSVTTIDSGAFEYCHGLESIVIEEGNPNYDSRENCNCLIETSTNILIQGCKNSFIPNSITSIGEYAFKYCFGLTGELVIPDSVTSIGSNAFSECKGLTSVIIGSGVTSIDIYSFYGCEGLTEITCHAPTAPTIKSNTFNNIKTGGVLKVPVGSDYSTWMSTSNYYLGSYNWTMEYI